MLVIATEPNEKMLLDIINHQLVSNDVRGEVVYILLKMISEERVTTTCFLRVIGLLLDGGQIDVCKKIINEVELETYVWRCTTYNQMLGLFNIFVDLGRSEDIARICKNESCLGNLSQEDTILLKISIGIKMILKGIRDSAKTVLLSVDETAVIKEELIAELCLAYLRLSMFEKGNEILLNLEKEWKRDQQFLTYKALYSLSVGKVEEALSLMNQFDKERYQIDLSLMWRIKIFNESGLQESALKDANQLLSRDNIAPAHRCVALIGKGDAYRELKKYSLAEKCYQEAEDIQLGATVWLWIACFEHAMMKLYLDDIENAFSIIARGCECLSPVYNEKYNPCIVLYDLIRLMLNQREGESSLSMDDRISNISLWPFPFLPHKIWMLFCLLSISKSFGDVRASRDVLRSILSSIEILNDNEKSELMIELADSCFDQILYRLNQIYLPRAFNWRVLKKLSLNNDSCKPKMAQGNTMNSGDRIC